MRMASGEWRMVLCVLLAQLSAASAIDLPDSSKTPGEARTRDYHAICESGSTAKVRHVSAATKRQVFANYGVTNKTGWCKPAGCEVDHLISLELGGSNATANLWPEPYAGEWNAHVKDKLENRLHRLICQRVLTPEQAQEAISRDWIAAFKRYQK